MIVANEIMQIDLTAAACVKQYVADLKSWMKVNGKKMRLLPLTYAAADSSYAGKIDNADDYHVLKVQGLLCGDKMKDGSMQKSIDIYLINEYRWCPKSTFAQAYQRLINFAQGIPIAVAFGEYGCKEDSAVPRDWGMIPYYYGKPADTNQFSEVYSGGVAYSYGEAKLATDAKFPMFTGAVLLLPVVCWWRGYLWIHFSLWCCSLYVLNFRWFHGPTEAAEHEAFHGLHQLEGHVRKVHAVQ